MSFVVSVESEPPVFPVFPVSAVFLQLHPVVLLMSLHQPMLVMNWFNWFMELWLGSLALPGPTWRCVPAEPGPPCRSPPLLLHVDLVHALISSLC